MGACCPSHVISNIQIRHANKRLLWQTACSTVVARRTLGCLVCAAIRTANLSQAAAHADPQLAAAHSALPGPSDMPYTPQPRICAAIRVANPQPGRCTCRPPAGCCTCRLAWCLRHALYSATSKRFCMHTQHIQMATEPAHSQQQAVSSNRSSIGHSSDAVTPIS